MTMKPITVMTVRRITSAAVVVIAFLLVTACSTQQIGSVSEKIPATTNEAVEAQLNAGKTLALPVEKTLPKSGIVLRLIPAGSFIMGTPESEMVAMIEFYSDNTATLDIVRLRQCTSPDEIQHKVTLTKAFYIGKYEVTQGQWKKVMGSNPSDFKDAGDDAPVENVSWHDCTNFMVKLAVLEGMPEGSFRLPTEAQWEYACRAGKTTMFCYGNALDSSMASFCGDYPFGTDKVGEVLHTTLPVGQFKPNAWGLYDMHGNVDEWCLDWYGKYGGEATDPPGPASGDGRVARGGNWFTLAINCRSAEREYPCPALTKSNEIGFRLALPAGL